MTEDELPLYAERLYEQAAEQAQAAADGDVDRQMRVANGLMDKPSYSPWWALPPLVQQSWIDMARQLAEQVEVHDALLGGI